MINAESTLLAKLAAKVAELYIATQVEGATEADNVAYDEAFLVQSTVLALEEYAAGKAYVAPADNRMKYASRRHEARLVDSANKNFRLY